MLKVAVALPLAFVALLASASYVVVDVTADGHHFILPVPLVVARAAAAFAPEECSRIACPEFAEYQEATERILEELLIAPDGELVHVQDGDETVLISKFGDALEVEVHSEDEDVSVSVPLEAVLDLVSRYDGEGFEASDVVKALGQISNSDLVHVRTEDEEVKIWIW
jgi:hypothetical protein